MRQPGTSKRYADYGHMPRSHAHPHGHSHRTPEVVVNSTGSGRGDEGEEPMGSDQRDMHAVDIMAGTAHNPNRADIPHTKRKGSYDPVSERVL